MHKLSLTYSKFWSIVTPPNLYQIQSWDDRKRLAEETHNCKIDTNRTHDISYILTFRSEEDKLQFCLTYL
jgi:hypothetical protein